MSTSLTASSYHTPAGNIYFLLAVDNHKRLAVTCVHRKHFHCPPQYLVGGSSHILSLCWMQLHLYCCCMCFSSTSSGAGSCEWGVGSEGESDGRHEQRKHHTHRGQPDSEEVRRTGCVCVCVCEGCRRTQRKWLHSSWSEGVQLCIQEAFHVGPVVWLVFYRGVLIQQCHVPITNVQKGVGSFARFQFPPLNGRPDSVCAIPHPLILRCILCEKHRALSETDGLQHGNTPLLLYLL